MSYTSHSPMIAPPRSPEPAVPAVWSPPPVSRPRGSVRFRRVALIAAALCLIPVVVSYVGTITQPSDSSLGIRTVEWMRDNGARGLVNSVENFYYSLNAPAKGGPQLHALPSQSGILATGVPSVRLHGVAPQQHFYRPPRIAPVIHPALPGEGVWHATFSAGGSRPPVLITSYRPDPNYPRFVAGVAWLDQTRTSGMLYPGLHEPAVPMPSRGPNEVPLPTRGQ